MKLVNARILGFQSFSDSGEIEFLSGINLVIGQNNAGKSALLRSLRPGLPDDRHRTPEMWQTYKLRTPEVVYKIDFSGRELRDWLLRSPRNIHRLPIPPAANANPSAFVEGEFFRRASFCLPIIQMAGGTVMSRSYPSHNLFHFSNAQHFCAAIAKANGDLSIRSEGQQADSLPELIWEAWSHDMFYFSAERMTIGEAPAGYADRLHPDATNLPNVLHKLDGESGDVFSGLVKHIRAIFPTVGNLSVRTRPDGKLEIRVWPTEERERLELSFPLDNSGTGVAQAIALLTAIMTLDDAIIIIDEINSFLHPAAVKALLRILQTRYAQHQYIISTHSPDVISFSNPKTIHLVKRTGYESSVQRLNLDSVGQFREVAEHLGVSMADVFAADRIIWVEGPTEELCFPYLFQQIFGTLPRGTIFTSVAAPGDLLRRKRDRTIVFDVYSRLSRAAATLVVSVAFSFDSETLTDQEKAEMQRDSGGLLHFLPRRHLECYLIDPPAIAAFIISRDPASVQSVTPEAVETSLRTAASERPFLNGEWKGDISDVNWLAHVDAAGLIKHVCGTLSEQRTTFAKKDDSLFLLQHMLERDSTLLTGLAEYVNSLVAAV